MDDEMLHNEFFFLPWDIVLSDINFASPVDVVSLLLLELLFCRKTKRVFSPEGVIVPKNNPRTGWFNIQTNYKKGHTQENITFFYTVGLI